MLESVDVNVASIRGLECEVWRVITVGGGVAGGVAGDWEAAEEREKSNQI